MATNKWTSLSQRIKRNEEEDEIRDRGAGPDTEEESTEHRKMESGNGGRRLEDNADNGNYREARDRQGRYSTTPQETDARAEEEDADEHPKDDRNAAGRDADH